jgi:putative redox protein
VDSWGHEVAIDADRAGTGVKPSDMLPIALAACTAYDVVSILRKQRQEVRGLEASIESTQEGDAPWRFERIRVRYVLRGAVDERKARKAFELSESKYCSISATLRPSVRLEFDLSVEPG